MSLRAICQDMRNEDNQFVYHPVLRFIENELHIKLTFYQTQILKYLLNESVQKHIQELYKESDTHQD